MPPSIWRPGLAPGVRGGARVDTCSEGRVPLLGFSKGEERSPMNNGREVFSDQVETT